MTAVRHDELRYYVLADRGVAFLLARVRWPGVAQAISAANPDWLDDMGLFDLPYDPGALAVTREQASSIAVGWGRQLDASLPVDVPSYIRRMPANWSNLSPSERGAWGLESVGRRGLPLRRRIRRAAVASAPSATGSERRESSRVPLGGRAHLRLGHATLTAGLVDLGERGAGCVLPLWPWNLAADAVLEGPVVLELEARASRLCLDVTSRVGWHRSAGNGTHFGLAFSELGAGELRGMQGMLAAASRTRTRGIA